MNDPYELRVSESVTYHHPQSAIDQLATVLILSERRKINGLTPWSA
jgi:hypothetical protein